MRYSNKFTSLFALLSALIDISLLQQKAVAVSCPCDIYEAGGTPCVAAHSTVRALYNSYDGPLYQVRRTSDNATRDIGVASPGGYANTAAQDSFLNGKPGTISIIYDQSPKKNDLAKSPKALWLSNGGAESNAADGKHTVGGHVVHGIYVTGYSTNVAYRNNATKGLAKNDEPEAMYMVVDGKRYSDQCCFDYGNAETSGKDDGDATMEALYFGTDITWGGKGNGNGPWVAADLENGVYKGNKGGWKSESLSWPNAKSVTGNYATAMLKGPSGNRFVLKAGDAQSGKLVTMWDGARPNGYSPMKKQGAIILGTGGDGSNGGTGTFFEGAITSGVPTDAVDDSIQASIVAAGYGRTTPTAILYSVNNAKTGSPFTVDYNMSSGRAVIGYALQEARRVSVNIFDQRGRRIAGIINGMVPAGRHEAVWDAKRVPVGVYVCRTVIDGLGGWTGKIVAGK
jgi:non-reducing end alpha-L-arabinofuranosidase